MFERFSRGSAGRRGAERHRASGCRSPASWPASGAATSTSRTVPAADWRRRSPSIPRARTGNGAGDFAGSLRWPSYLRSRDSSRPKQRAMSPPGWIRWLGFALLGIVVAAAVSIAASRLSSQQIGLASEPISAGDQLVPKAAAPATPRPQRRQHRRRHRDHVPAEQSRRRRRLCRRRRRHRHRRRRPPRRHPPPRRRRRRRRSAHRLRVRAMTRPRIRAAARITPAATTIERSRLPTRPEAFTDSFRMPCRLFSAAMVQLPARNQLRRKGRPE